MTRSQQNVRDFMLGVGQECPDKPTIPNAETRILRVKLLLEEVLEFAHASGIAVKGDMGDDMTINDYTFVDRAQYGPPFEVDLIGVADGLSDINYVSYGAAISYGLNLEPFEEEVHRSNMTKVIGGYKREDGKWVKPSTYEPANLGPILEKQQNF